MRPIALVLAFALAGCAGTLPDLKPTRTTAVCTVLIGPIKYNSVNVKSARHAGPKLAPDLKQRNQLGHNLHCPAYK